MQQDAVAAADLLFYAAGSAGFRNQNLNRGGLDTRLSSTLAELRANRRRIFNELLRYPDSWLDRSCHADDHVVPARWEFLSFADHDEEHLIQIIDTLSSIPQWRRTKIHRLLGAAEATRGELLAVLCGLTDDDLDVAPSEPPGEWTLRLTLSHIIFVEHAYRIDILHAVERFNAGEPFGELPDVDLPYNYPDDTLQQLFGRLDDARDQNIRELQHLTDTDLRAPAVWSPAEVDTEFLIMRLAHHEREHTAHIHKWRIQTGKDQTEIQRLLGLAWITQGRIRAEMIGVPEHVLTAHPLDGERSVNEILDHLDYADHVFSDRIHAATE